MLISLTYVKYRNQELPLISDDEFECILLYWKPDITYCQGLKSNWLGDDALRFFSIHAALSLIQEISNLIRNVSNHYPELTSELKNKRTFWSRISRVTATDISDLKTLNTWLMDYKYEISTRLNPVNLDGILSIEPKQMLVYLTDALRLDFDKFENNTNFSVVVAMANPSVVEGELELGSCIGAFMPQCVFTALPKADKDGVLTQAGEFQAHTGATGTEIELFLGFS